MKVESEVRVEVESGRVESGGGEWRVESGE